MKKQINEFKKILKSIEHFDIEDKLEILNLFQEEINKISPQKQHPINCIKWIKSEKIIANDYNPNKVAPPEMKLLYLSIKEDGYTQPIVCYYDKELDKYIIVDGFHRNRVGKEYSDINKSINDYLPIVLINKDINSRMASTIRHNRARGTHQVQGMSEIVAELHLKGMSDKKICEQLGMEKDEVLRLKQFMGLGNLFKNREFSKSWI